AKFATIIARRQGIELGDSERQSDTRIQEKLQLHSEQDIKFINSETYAKAIGAVAQQKIALNKAKVEATQKTRFEGDT
ncbi:MAG: hypothetical protein GWN00_39570, partial [Aliifodinibius sp.]|nr:hypothetical protein [Fodinibius sp.]NIV16666.1 hypothetical protein [Fodinibius sp.]NIY30660.1 hypothetical protein [Fodinibius sp.]